MPGILKFFFCFCKEASPFGPTDSTICQGQYFRRHKQSMWDKLSFILPIILFQFDFESDIYIYARISLRLNISLRFSEQINGLTFHKLITLDL